MVKPLHKYRFRIGIQPRGWQPRSVCDGVQVPAGVHLRNFAVVVQVSLRQCFVRLFDIEPGSTVHEFQADRASLRFLTPSELDGFLTEAGFAIEGRYGNWKRDPMTEKSHIITVARRVS